ncbi:hypothetical protein SAMN04487884_1278 [Butyrivibrio fibrisolvens]|uniref:Uncharacterized protein n=2 Tax=Butyrivibrio fibrisolvens TaxID=831 RepID=A0A1H9W453_BUTFI|nr:hypothetical protein SAMN04487884_1278 [Butyrivibrio fibrisolvens]
MDITEAYNLLYKYYSEEKNLSIMISWTDRRSLGFTIIGVEVKRRIWGE